MSTLVKGGIQDGSLFVFGRTGAGKSHVAITHAYELISPLYAAQDENGDTVAPPRVLYITFGGNATGDYAFTEDWDVFEVDDYAELYREVIQKLSDKNRYDVIILDGLEGLFPLMASVNEKSGVYSEEEYGRVGIRILDVITKIKRYAGRLIATCNVWDSPKRGREIQLYPNMRQKIVNRFQNKWFIYARKGKAGTNEVVYRIQKVKALAMSFQELPEPTK